MPRSTIGVTYEGGASPAASPGESFPRAPGPPRLPRKRRRSMFALAALLLGLGSLGTVFLVTSMTHRVSVVMVAKDVPIGSPISAGDLGTSMVSVDRSIATIPARQLGEVVGKIAGVDLRRGTLLSPGQLTGTVSPAQGQEIVPVALTTSQLPARGLQPGDQVLVVVTQGSQQDAGGAQGKVASTPQQQDTPAGVDRVGQPDADGKVVVDLLVTSQVGPTIARQAAAGKIALVLSPRRP